MIAEKKVFNVFYMSPVNSSRSLTNSMKNKNKRAQTSPINYRDIIYRQFSVFLPKKLPDIFYKQQILTD